MFTCHYFAAVVIQIFREPQRLHNCHSVSRAVKVQWRSVSYGTEARIHGEVRRHHWYV